MTFRDTARGIGIRAIILVIAVIVIGATLLWLAFELAGAAIQLLFWIIVILIGVAVIAVATRRFRRR
jgi:hypothetical protein